MNFKYGQILSTAFSAALIVGSAVMVPADAHVIEQPTAVMQPAKEAFQNANLKLCALERRRLLNDARVSTMTDTHLMMSSRQEIAMGLQL